MRHSVYQNTFMLYISIIFFINIAPVTMQTITLEIQDLQSIVTSSLDRLLGAVDPTIDKVQNATVEILCILKNRIKANISETLYWLETNLFVLLFAFIIFFIFVFILLNFLDILLLRYGFTPEIRRCFGLAIITVVFVWLFIAMVLSTWPPSYDDHLQTLKYVSVAFLILVVLCLIIIWIHYIYDHFGQLRGHGSTNTILVQGTPPKNAQENIPLETLRL